MMLLFKPWAPGSHSEILSAVPGCAEAKQP